MSEECRNEVKRHETRAAKDYRLNYRLNKACDLEIDRLCADVCSPFSGQACEGTVIQCLTQKAENITDQVQSTQLIHKIFATNPGKVFTGMQEGDLHHGEDHGE